MIYEMVYSLSVTQGGNMITKQDLFDAIKNVNRPIKRRTCNYNGTIYTINRIMYSNVKVIRRKKVK